jgi:hypothetical protein
MSTNSTISNKITPSRKSDKDNSFINYISNYESLVVFGSIILIILIVIIFTGLFVAGPVVRDNLFYNIGIMILLAFLFVYIIFKFMDYKIVFLGKSFDFGAIVYLFIIVFVVFVLAN